MAALHSNVLPMSLASATTALGFLGLTLSPSPPVRVVGYLVAVGIGVSLVLCMTLLPVLQARFDPWKPDSKRSSKMLGDLAEFVNRRRLMLVVSFLVAAVPAGWLASRNAIDDNVFEYFSASHEFHQDTQIVEARLSGVNELLLSVDTGRPFGIFDAASVQAVDSLSEWLRQQPEVKRVVSLSDADVLVQAKQDGRLQQRLDFYREHVTSDGVGPHLALEVSGDYSASIVSAYLKQLNSGRLLDFERKLHAWAGDNLGNYVLTSGGPALMFANLGEQNIRGMLTALSIALVVAAVVLGSVLRSCRIGMVGLVCNLLPVLFVYAVWAMLDGQISIGAAVVLGMILGIVLDDTIYLLASYRNALKRGLSDAVSYAIRRVGPALIVTTITLVVGLSLGLLSDFGPIRNMSVLSVGVIATALAVDLLLLPALLPPARKAT